MSRLPDSLVKAIGEMSRSELADERTACKYAACASGAAAAFCLGMAGIEGAPELLRDIQVGQVGDIIGNGFATIGATVLGGLALEAFHCFRERFSLTRRLLQSNN